jgi:ribosomal protein S18 acetylase RimI-like enzyme
VSADPAAIRAILETDRVWAIYALADLTPAYSAHAEWRVAGSGRALLLIYRAFQPPVLFAHGPAADLAPLLAGLAEPEFYLSVRPEVVELLRAGGYEVRDRRMSRMQPDPRRFTSWSHNAARLGPADGDDLRVLYADGIETGESPPFFDAGMLQHGVYYGIREAGGLIAAAGTHVLSEEESLAAIGNVYTRRDCRGRGLGADVTAAVTAEVLQRGLRTIALNVAEDNAAAAHVYTKLGFERYCEYREGIAVAPTGVSPRPECLRHV